MIAKLHEEMVRKKAVRKIAVVDLTLYSDSDISPTSNKTLNPGTSSRRGSSSSSDIHSAAGHCAGPEPACDFK